MKLRFDANLSPKLVPRLTESFPGSSHVLDVGLGEATDDAIWDWAKTRGFLIVSKDNDFRQRAFLEGHRPR